MEIRPIQQFDIEQARLLLRANGGQHGVASHEEFGQLLARSHRVLAAVEDAADTDAAAFYDKIGFVQSTVAMERPGAKTPAA